MGGVTAEPCSRGAKCRAVRWFHTRGGARVASGVARRERPRARAPESDVDVVDGVEVGRRRRPGVPPGAFGLKRVLGERRCREAKFPCRRHFYMLHLYQVAGTTP